MCLDCFLKKKHPNTVFSVRTLAGLPRQKMLPKHKLTLRFSGWLDAFAPGGACPGHPVAVTLAGCFLNGLKTEPQSGKPLRGVPPLPGQPFPPSTLQNGRAVWRSAKGVQEGARAWSPEGLGTFSAWGPLGLSKVSTAPVVLVSSGSLPICVFQN